MRDNPEILLAYPHSYSILGAGVTCPDDVRAAGPAADGYPIAIERRQDRVRVTLPHGDSRSCRKLILASTPNPDVLCASILGASYLIDTSRDFSVRELRTVAACALVQVVEESLLAIVDYTSVLVLSRDGTHHRSDALSQDQIELISADGPILTIRVYSAPDGEWSQVHFDLRSALMDT